MFALFSGKKFLSLHIMLEDAEDVQQEFLEKPDSTLASHIVEVKDLREFHKVFWEGKVTLCV